MINRKYMINHMVLFLRNPDVRLHGSIGIRQTVSTKRGEGG